MEMLKIRRPMGSQWNRWVLSNVHCCLCEMKLIELIFDSAKLGKFRWLTLTMNDATFDNLKRTKCNKTFEKQNEGTRRWL